MTESDAKRPDYQSLTGDDRYKGCRVKGLNESLSISDYAYSNGSTLP